MHKLLARQLRRKAAIGNPAQWRQALAEITALGSEPWLPPQAAQVLSALPELFAEFDNTYSQFDRDLELRRRSLEISSAELMQLNNQLRVEAASRQRALDSLREAANRLMSGAGLPLLQEGEANLESLSSLMARLAQEREATQQELGESEARFRSLTELSSDWYWEQDEQFRFTATHGESEARAGITADAHVGCTRWDLPHTHPLGFTWDEHRATLVRREAFRDLVLKREVPGEDAHYVSVSGTPIFNAQGIFTGYRGIAKDVTERMRVQEALRQSQVAAEAATRAKSQFLANMSHEIRTPMNGVLGMTELLLGTSLDARQRQLAETVRRSGEGLLALINDILDFSKIEAGKMEIDRVDFVLRDVVEDVAQLLSESAAAKGLDLVCRVLPGVPAVIAGDPNRVRQILINLIGNAIKFTAHGEVVTEVRMANTPRGGQRVLCFEVRDTGIGIATEAQTHIFGAFSQADGSTTRHYGGTGLGLAICRQLVLLMGGDMSLQSKPGRGSTFRFTVPCVSATAPGPHEEPMTHAGRLRGRKLLIVDDNVACCEAVRDVADGIFGMRCSIAHDGLDALRLLREAAARRDAFDAAIVDCDLPQAGVLARVAPHERDPALKGLRVIQATTLDRAGDAGRARAAGYAGVITKPVRRADLLRVFLPAFGVDPGAVSQSLRAAATGSVAAPAALQGRVLVAEDYPLNQQVIRAVLELHGCEVTMAQNGREAVEAVQRESFDLVFMDCQMPELDGYMATRAIRALEQESGGQSRRTPIVALTAHATQADRERCLNAGMDSYVSKPFTQVVLLQELRRWLTGARHEATVPAVVSDFADTQRLDTRTLNELRSLDRNAPAETLRGFVQTYLAHTAVLLGRIGAALAAGDLASIESEAHKLKSGSLTMGAVRVGKLAQVLEQACHAGDASRSRALLAQIEAEFALAEKLLQAHVVETSVAA